MVGPVNGGFQQQIPGATSFKPGESNQPSPLDTLKQNLTGPPKNAATQTTLQPGKTEEITQQTVLSRDVSRPNPNDPFASNNARGSVLDISV